MMQVVEPTVLNEIAYAYTYGIYMFFDFRRLQPYGSGMRIYAGS